MSRRIKRLNVLVQEELARLITVVRDPRLAEIVSITRVDVSPDLETSQVYVSVLGTEDEKRDSIEALSHAAPYLRRELLRRVHMKKVPVLHFVLDESIEEAAHILDLMRRIGDEPATP
jgi:ribosome-binding factor A